MRRLRDQDPARSVPPLSPETVHTLIHNAMKDGTYPKDHNTNPNTADNGGVSGASEIERQRKRRSLLIGGVGIAAAAALVTAVVLPTLDDDGQAPPQAMQSTRLMNPSADPGAPAAMCAVPTSDYLAALPLAFAATVVSVQDGVAELEVTERFVGTPEDRVLIPDQGTDPEIDGGPLTYNPELSYLIASDGEYVLTCGLSGTDTPELRALYSAAFK